MAQVKKETADKAVKALAKKAAEEVVKAAPSGQEAVSEPKTTKAGKRSPKAHKEAEEKQAKEHRKTEAVDTKTAKVKTVKNPPRSRLQRAGKKYRKLAEQIEKGRSYSLTEALELVTKTSPTKFDATVELHVRLGVDPKQADQNVRDSVLLPAGSGKQVKVAVFVEDDDAAKAKAAGADIIGVEKLIPLLDKQQLEFDILISTPTLMPRLSKYARLLGPRGLMPNPKSGTVASDVARAVKEAKAGKIEYRVDSYGIVHTQLGKVSFGAEKLLANAEAILSSIRASKPASIKGNYIVSLFIATSMGPSIPVQTAR